MRNVLKRHGLGPAPGRAQRSWREFVRQHADLLLVVDFFIAGTVWLQRLHVLFLMEVGSRCVHIAGCTALDDTNAVATQLRAIWAILRKDGALSLRRSVMIAVTILPTLILLLFSVMQAASVPVG